MMKKFNFSVINLWCNKNLVDLEFLIWTIFQEKSKNFDINFLIDPDLEEVEYVIINTCWFLSSSRWEAEETVEYYDNLWKKIIIMWCYVEVKDNNFLLGLKNLVTVLPHNKSKDLSLIFDNENLSTLVQKMENKKEEQFKNYLEKLPTSNIDKKAFLWQWTDNRAYLNTDFGYEYLKVAEWCDNNCTFCIIPRIRWRQISRSIEDVLLEVKNMISLWVKEIQIIAQDLTRYWTDLYWESRLIELLEEIDKIPWEFKYRLYYVYPDMLSLENIEKMWKLKKIIPYFDIPFQHISPKILKRMGRFYNEEHIYKLLDKIKEVFPNAFIHTNFIVGFPGEDESDLEKLKEFIKKYRFDSVSMFGYHDEELATSSKLDKKIPEREIEKRTIEISKILNKIYDEKDEARRWKKEIWFVMDILENSAVIRPEIKAPEIDEYDTVKFDKILAWEISIWSKVEYIV